MAQTITWDEVEGAVSYNVYRGTSQFDLATLPEDVQSVASEDRTISYTDAVRQTVYWFVISSVDADGGETFGEVFNAGYFPESGPGSTELIRGDWSFGFFGEVPASDLFTFTEIQQNLLTLGSAPMTPLSTFEDGVYFKVIVNGKILFIPNGAYGALTAKIGNSAIAQALSNYGYGQANKANCPVISKNGLEFMHRLPNYSDNDSDYMKSSGGFPVNAEPFTSSEAAMLISMFSNGVGSTFSLTDTDVSKNAQSVKLKLGDYTAIDFIVPRYSTNNIYEITTAGALTSAAWYTNGAPGYHVIPVLELLF